MILQHQNSILGGKNVSDNNVLKGALLIGPNASGKSNVLKGLSFIIKMIKGEGASFSNYRCFFSKNPITILEYEFLFNNKEVKYVIEYNTRTNSISENLKIDNITVLQRNGMDLDDASNGLFLRTPADDISAMV